MEKGNVPGKFLKVPIAENHVVCLLPKKTAGGVGSGKRRKETTKDKRK